MAFPTPLASLLENPTLKELIAFQLTGLVVVFSALIAIWVMLEIVGRFFRNRAPVPVVVAQPAATPVVSADAGTEPQIIAAISAAVHIVLQGKPHRIASIKVIEGQPSWAAEGRGEHFSSHRVR